MTEVTIGADPEVFVIQKGKPVSAHTFGKGTKEEPHWLTEDVAVQVDGTALEFNIKPATTRDEFKTRITEALHLLKNMIGNREFNINDTVEYPEDYFFSLPFENLEIGCDADYDAYTMDKLPPPEEMEPVRYAGGHIHVGFQNFNGQGTARLGRLMDLFVGNSIVNSQSERGIKFANTARYRPKPYGIEYRRLSNNWIFSEESIETVYDNTRLAADSFIQGYDVNKGCWDMVRRISCIDMDKQQLLEKVA